MRTTLLSMILLGVAALTLTIALVYFTGLVRSGKKLCQTKPGASRDVLVFEHRWYVNRFLISFYMTVAIVEWMVREQGGRLSDPTLFYIHLFVFALPLTLAQLLMRFYITGLKYPVWHRRLGNFVQKWLPCVLGTGFVLIVKLLMNFFGWSLP